jgi:hypothetical protein
MRKGRPAAGRRWIDGTRGVEPHGRQHEPVMMFETLRNIA